MCPADRRSSRRAGPRQSPRNERRPGHPRPGGRSRRRQPSPPDPGPAPRALQHGPWPRAPPGEVGRSGRWPKARQGRRRVQPRPRHAGRLRWSRTHQGVPEAQRGSARRGSRPCRRRSPATRDRLRQSRGRARCRTRAAPWLCIDTNCIALNAQLGRIRGLAMGRGEGAAGARASGNPAPSPSLSRGRLRAAASCAGAACARITRSHSGSNFFQPAA